MQRREFLRLSASAGALALLHLAGVGCSRSRPGTDGPLKLPPLPYPLDALEPHLSEKALALHYGKHHRGYVDQANQLITGTRYADLSLEQIIRKSHAKGACDQDPLYNHTSQVYNHTFYWNSMRPKGGGRPSGALLDLLGASFDSYERFREAFLAAATERFGSGWVWLVLGNGKLELLALGNAGSPLVHDRIPLLVCDVWEHAYYPDYQNRRAAYVATWLDRLVNWQFAEHNLGEI